MLYSCVVPNLVVAENFSESWPSVKFLAVYEGRSLASENSFVAEFNFVWYRKAEIQECYYKSSKKEKLIWYREIDRLGVFFFKFS